MRCCKCYAEDSESEGEEEEGGGSGGEDEEEAGAGGGAEGAARALRKRNRALSGEVARHKAELERLREQDPEFYEYLKASPGWFSLSLRLIQRAACSYTRGAQL